MYKSTLLPPGHLHVATATTTAASTTAASTTAATVTFLLGCCSSSNLNCWIKYFFLLLFYSDVFHVPRGLSRHLRVVGREAARSASSTDQ